LSALDKALEYSRKLKIDECEIVHVKRKTITVRITDSEIFELKQNQKNSFDSNK
jgi:PmbA protein